MEQFHKIKILEDQILKNLSPEPFLKAKDYTVSKKEFELRYNKEFDMLVTFPRPENDRLPEFYKSEKYISHTDSDRSIFDKIYQLVKTHMVDKKLKWIEERKQEKGRILDIGAGTGDFLGRAKKRGWIIEGIEPNETARARAQEKGVFLKEESASFPSESFDVITLWHVLEHVPDLNRQIKEIQRLLKKDGLLVIAVPNFKSYDAKKYKGNWAAFDVPRHLWHFSGNSISRIFRSYSLSVVEEKSLPFDSFYVSLLSENYRTGSQNLFRGLYMGFISNLKAARTKEHSSIAYFIKKV